MSRIGLPDHGSGRERRERIILVAGYHRLEAARRLGWEKISVVYVWGDEAEFRLWEIAENLHRAELSALAGC